MSFEYTSTSLKYQRHDSKVSPDRIILIAMENVVGTVETSNGIHFKSKGLLVQ